MNILVKDSYRFYIQDGSFCYEEITKYHQIITLSYRRENYVEDIEDILSDLIKIIEQEFKDKENLNHILSILAELERYYSLN
jgi:ABC-type enterochelin transport system substrate-binding protein